MSDELESTVEQVETCDEGPACEEYAVLKRHDDEVRSLANKVAQLEREAADASAIARDAKKMWEAASRDLTALARMSPSPGPLFDATATEDAWREVTLSELGIVAGVAEKLSEANLWQLGAIADWTTAGHRFTEIKGIGEGAAEKIEDAIERYWAKHMPTAPEGEPEYEDQAD